MHACWAPRAGRWNDWVKSALFACLPEETKPKALPEGPAWLQRDVIEPLARAAQASHSAQLVSDTVIVVDLPGAVGALVGVGLVDYGFRPVPLYAAAHHERAVVDMAAVMDVLVDAATRVASASPAAPPAFLLDSRRMTGRVASGAYDNRSMCSARDFPSADALWQRGVRRVVLIQVTPSRPAPDLEPVLLSWQSRGLVLFRKTTDGSQAAISYTLRARCWVLRRLHDVRQRAWQKRAVAADRALPEYSARR